MIAIFSVVPLGKEALSSDVAKVIDIIDRSGIDYRLTAMGTIVEGEPGEVWTLVRRCHEKMRECSRRVHTQVTIDDREDATGTIRSKVDDIERHLARKLRT
ncbi:MAG: MTH1187 family thiamine-binding protein [Candidatus Krumholzibacteriia bacterium]